MNAESWLVLTDYASKYRISVSTLRRRIKAEQVPYRFENGKYFLLDSAPEPIEPPIVKAFVHVRPPMEEKMITEEQMLRLKKEVSDLKTLVCVLEDDNDRMRNLLGLRSTFET